MSFLALPREIRLQIWALLYFSEPPRLVTLRTKPHDESHAEDIFCPRYSATPAPAVVNICREARLEAEYQARRASHLIRLPSPFDPSPSELYFRFDTDILFIDLDSSTKHFDGSPDAGLLAHFHDAVGCYATLLKKVAITQVVRGAFEDGALSYCLRDFPGIEHLVMVLRVQDMWTEPARERFVRAARRIVTQYRLDMRIMAKARGEVYVHDERRLDIDFAVHNATGLEILEKEIWSGWDELEEGWWLADVEQRYIDFLS